VKLEFNATPTVSRFLDSSAFVRAIIGPIGSGKSSGCVMEILRRAAEQAPGPDGIRHTRFAVIRNTRPQLEDTTRKTFEQWIPESIGKWSEADFEFRIKRGDIDCEVLFRALDRPQDVRKVLSLELTGAYINEAREIAKEIVDGLQGRVGRFPSKKDGGATWFGIWMDTNPWHTGHWGYDLFSRQRPHGFELFEQPSGLSEEAENVENLPDGYYQRLMNGKDQEWIDEYLRAMYPNANKGSVYGELIAKLEARGGISDFEHPDDGVFVNFDLGVSDSTAMFWWRIGKHGVPDVIDWYEASGEGASHYFEVLDGGTPVGCDRPRKYKLKKIWLPHDARQRTFQTGVTTLDQFLAECRKERWGNCDVAIGPEVDIEPGLSAGRWLLEQPIRIHSRCAEGVRRLREYRYQWDEDKKVFSKKPMHDWTSHTADNWRYVALVAKTTEQMMRKPEDKPQAPAARDIDSFTLDELFDARERGYR
jgi:hypothetical protein